MTNIKTHLWFFGAFDWMKLISLGEELVLSFSGRGAVFI